MLRHIWQVATLCVVLAFVCIPAWGAETAPAAAPAPAADASAAPADTTAAPVERPLVDQIKNPVDWLNWGMDLRVREEYLKNNIDLMSDYDDDRNQIRTRGRLWLQLGPVLPEDTFGSLKAYGRLTGEPRFFLQQSDFAPVAVPTRLWDEIVWDNLYVQWDKIGGLPFSAKAGRQDLTYGRGWLIFDGTPLDGGRTIYSDALKTTLLLDEYETSLDLVMVDNKAHQSRMKPISDDNALISEYDMRMFIAYLKNASLKSAQVHAYYIYADQDLIKVSKSLTPRRTIHTAGALLQGVCVESLDYYLESAYQWGKEGGADRSAWGLNSDVGYTFKDCRMKPRIHAGYEYLTGDDPNSKTYEGWDALLGRWPQWSEIFASRYAFEGGMPANYSNLHRAVFGVSAEPIPKMKAIFDYSLLWADQHTFGTSNVAPPPIPMPFNSGYFRGQLYKAVTQYKFNRFVDGELYLEYFVPGNFYDDTTEDAVFLRWQLNFTF